MTARRLVISLLSLLLVVGWPAGQAGTVEAAASNPVALSVVASPLSVSVWLSTRHVGVGEPLLAIVSVRNLGATRVTRVTYRLLVDARGLRPNGPLGALTTIGGHQVGSGAFHICPLVPGSYLVAAQATATGVDGTAFTGTSPAVLLVVTRASRLRCH